MRFGRQLEILGRSVAVEDMLQCNALPCTVTHQPMPRCFDTLHADPELHSDPAILFMRGLRVGDEHRSSGHQRGLGLKLVVDTVCGFR